MYGIYGEAEKEVAYPFDGPSPCRLFSFVLLVCLFVCLFDCMFVWFFFCLLFFCFFVVPRSLTFTFHYYK